MRWVWLIIGVIAIILGIIWTLQGLNILGGSVMSGHAIFAVIGPIISVIGLVVVGLCTVGRRARSA